MTSCTTGETPDAKTATSSSADATASLSTNAAPEPTLESDEDQVLDTVYAFQDAYNTQNWDAYRALACSAMRERLIGPVMDITKMGRINNGLSQVISVEAKVDGDSATATMEVQTEILGRATNDIPLVREDGWKVCIRA